MLTQVKKTQITLCAGAALLLSLGMFPAQAVAQDDPTSASPATATALDDPTLAEPDRSKDKEGDSPSVEVREKSDAEDDEDDKDWSLMLSLSSQMYQGMFVNLENQSSDLSSPHASDPSGSFGRWSNSYSIVGSYQLDDFQLLGSFDVSHWLTRGGGSIEPYELRASDVNLGLSWDGYKIEPIDTKIALAYTMGLPVSVYSRNANLILDNRLAASVSRKFFDKLTLRFTTLGGWSPHTTTSPTVDKEIAQIFREDDIVGNEIQVLGGVSTEFSWSNALAVSFPIWDKLSASATYSYTRYWSHHRDLDPQFDAPLQGLQTSGRNTGDAVTGTLGLSYPVLKYLSLSGGISSSQTPKTADNKGFRFPWWNFSGAGANLSRVYLSATATF